MSIPAAIPKWAPTGRLVPRARWEEDGREGGEGGGGGGRTVIIDHADATLGNLLAVTLERDPDVGFSACKIEAMPHKHVKIRIGDCPDPEAALHRALDAIEDDAEQLLEQVRVRQYYDSILN